MLISIIYRCFFKGFNFLLLSIPICVKDGDDIILNTTTNQSFETEAIIGYLKDEVNEMALLSKIVTSSQRDLLKHPLAEAFLHLKWQLMKKFVYLNILLYGLFLLGTNHLLHNWQDFN